MFNRLNEHRHEVLAFMECSHVPFDNNQGRETSAWLKSSKRSPGYFAAAKVLICSAESVATLQLPGKIPSRLLEQLLMPSRANPSCWSFSVVFGFQRTGIWANQPRQLHFQ